MVGDRPPATGHRQPTTHPSPFQGRESESQGVRRLANITIAGQDTPRRPAFSPPTWKGGGREGGRSPAHRPRRRIKGPPPHPPKGARRRNPPPHPQSPRPHVRAGPPPDLPPERGEERRPGRAVPERSVVGDRPPATGHRQPTTHPSPFQGRESESQGVRRLANITIAGQDTPRRPAFSPPTWKGGGREGGRSPAHRPRRRTKAPPAANFSPPPERGQKRNREGPRTTPPRHPLPTSPLKGGRSQGVRAEDTAPTSLSPGRSHPAAPPSPLPPGRGEVGRGVDPPPTDHDAGQRGRSPARQREPDGAIRSPPTAEPAPAPPRGTPLPTSPLKGGRSQRIRAEDTAPTSLSPGRTRPDALPSPLPPGRGEVGRGVPHRRAGRAAGYPPRPPLPGGREDGAPPPPPLPLFSLLPPPSLLPPGRGEVGRGVDPPPTDRDAGQRRPPPPTSPLPLKEGRSATGKARERPRRGTPLPTSPLKGGRSGGDQGGGYRANIAAAGQKPPRRPAFSPPPWKGGGREGGDPGFSGLLFERFPYRRPLPQQRQEQGPQLPRMRIALFGIGRIDAGMSPIVRGRRVDHHKRLSAVHPKAAYRQGPEFRHAFVFPGLSLPRPGQPVSHGLLHEFPGNVAHPMDGKPSRPEVLQRNRGREESSVPDVLGIEHLPKEELVIGDDSGRNAGSGADPLVEMGGKRRQYRIRPKAALRSRRAALSTPGRLRRAGPVHPRRGRNRSTSPYRRTRGRHMRPRRRPPTGN